MINSKEIIKYLRLEYQSKHDFNIKFLKPLSDLSDFCVSFINSTDPSLLSKFESLPENILVIVPNKLKENCKNLKQAFIFSSDPRLDFIKILQKFFVSDDSKSAQGIHPTAIIDKNAKIHPSVTIGANSIIEKCSIDEGTQIHENVHIFSNVKIGKNVIIRSTCTIGSHGFGFSQEKNGTWIRFPHMGGVIIGDNVEIFPLTNIDRGTLGNTIMRDGVKIDHCCHIGHNVVIDKNSIITACTVIGGSTTIGENAFIGPNSSIMDRINIGNNVQVGLGSVVLKSVEDNVIIAGNPAKVIRRK
ncbi:MAG: DapH/DapD/GlmU-related protein [Methanosarcinales archaeon]